MIPTGVAASPPKGYEFQIRPRSSMSAMGILCHFGTIDADYTGELMVLLQNISNDMWKVVEHGQRIAQLVCAPVSLADVVVVDDLQETARGAGGFGSTGEY